METFKLGEDDARILSEDHETSDFYEELVRVSGDPKKSCSYITTILFAIFEAHHEKIHLSHVRSGATEIGEVIKMVNNDEVSSTNSKLIVEKLVFEGGKASEWIDTLGLRQSNDTSALETIADQVIAEQVSQVAEYKAGKEALFGFFVGQCMKASKGQGNPKIFTEILKKKLG
jgi:aspartyl-tRNA(Asn)/glutamyl-tRNA(Gln) amidotransferase subunit B